jgi:hypothetical protein
MSAGDEGEGEEDIRVVSQRSKDAAGALIALAEPVQGEVGEEVDLGEVAASIPVPASDTFDILPEELGERKDHWVAQKMDWSLLPFEGGRRLRAISHRLVCLRAELAHLLHREPLAIQDMSHRRRVPYCGFRSGRKEIHGTRYESAIACRLDHTCHQQRRATTQQKRACGLCLPSKHYEWALAVNHPNDTFRECARRQAQEGYARGLIRIDMVENAQNQPLSPFEWWLLTFDEKEWKRRVAQVEGERARLKDEGHKRCQWVVSTAAKLEEEFQQRLPCAQPEVNRLAARLAAVLHGRYAAMTDPDRAWDAGDLVWSTSQLAVGAAGGYLFSLMNAEEWSARNVCSMLYGTYTVDIEQVAARTHVVRRGQSPAPGGEGAGGSGDVVDDEAVRQVMLERKYDLDEAE